MYRKNISLGENGRIVIPAKIRKELGIERGHRIRLTLKGTKIILEKADSAVEKLQKRFSHIQNNLADELIQERRKEARKEQGS